jgi:arylsulfatase A-like enzyme
VIWEEGLRVPLIIHAPGWFANGERVKELSNHTDVLPTVLEMLGYEVRNGEYPGYSLLRSLPKDRTLTFGCFHEEQCLASLKGAEKYVYHYGNQPEELFDLAQDPAEQRNLVAGERPEEVAERSKELLRWRSEVNATYSRE